MAVISVQQKGEQRGKRELVLNKGKIRSYRRTYEVVSNTKEDTEARIAKYGPGLGTSHPGDRKALCISKEAWIDAIEDDARGEGGGGVELYFWKLLAEYSNDPDRILGDENDDDGQGGTGGGGASDVLQSPLWPITPAKYDYGFDRLDIIVEEDLNGDAIVNTAGDPYNKPPSITIPIPTMTIRVNLGDFDPGFIKDYALAINAQAFGGYAPSQALVLDISAQEQSFKNEDDLEIPYHAVSAKIGFNERAWTLRLLSMGVMELYDLDPGPGRGKRHITVGGVPVKSPVMLDMAGEYSPDVNGIATPYYKPFAGWKVADFDVFYY